MADNFQRLFYIFKNMDRDEGSPAGYIRIETNGGRTKLQVSLSNLARIKELRYQLYGIAKKGSQIKYTVICDLPEDKSRADIKMDMDPVNIGSERLRLKDINIFVIASSLTDRVTEVKIPLVAYTDGEVPWRAEFEEAVANKEQYRQRVEDSTERANSLTLNDERLQADVDIDEGSVQEPSANDTEEMAEIKAAELRYEEPAKKNSTAYISSESDNHEDISVTEASGIKGEMMAEAGRIDIRDLSAEAEEDNLSGTASSDKIESDYSQVGAEASSCDNESPQAADNTYENHRSTPFSISNKFESAVTSVYRRDGSAQANMDRMPLLPLDDEVMPEMEYREPENADTTHSGPGKLFNIQEFKEELNRSFESYNPFKMKSKNYIWWKVNSPGYLNNILFKNSIRTYLLFNPKVMLAHYKYRYIIFGLRSDKRSSRDYLICGVPGVYSIDQNPFGNMGSWAQTEGFKPRYGAFGYWVIMIDPRTGKLMKVK